MQSPKEFALEWKRIYDSERALREAMRERGVTISDDAPLEQYAEAIRSYIPPTMQIYRKEFYYKSPQERMPNMIVAPSYNPADLSWTFGMCANLSVFPEVMGLDQASSLSHYGRDCILARGHVVIPNLPKCTHLVSIFQNCPMLESITIGDAPLCVDANFVAGGCSNLTSIKIGALPRVKDVRGLITGCALIERIDLQFGSEIRSANGMFQGCTSLRVVTGIIDVTNADIGNIVNGCSALEEIRLKGIKDNIAFHTSPKLSLDSARYLITEAQSVIGKTIYFPQTLADTHRTDMEELGEMASAKGWAITYR